MRRVLALLPPLSRISAPGTRSRRDTGEFIGWFSLKYAGKSPDVEIGYRLLPDAWGQGFATEGATAIVRYGFDDLGLDRIIGVTHPGQRASQRVLHEGGARAMPAGAATTTSACACSRGRPIPTARSVTPLTTPRLVLRHFDRGDVDDLYAMDRDDRVMRFIGAGLKGRTRKECEVAIARMVELRARTSGVRPAAREPARRRGFVGGCGLFPGAGRRRHRDRLSAASCVLGPGLRDRDGQRRARARIRRSRACAHRRAGLRPRTCRRSACWRKSACAGKPMPSTTAARCAFTLQRSREGA